MRHIIELNPTDIRKIIAEHFKVDQKQVAVNTGMTSVGYGMDEHYEPYVRVEVELKEENK